MIKTTSSIGIVFLFIFLLGFSNNTKAQLDTNDFVTTWKTNYPGNTNDSSITISIDTNFTYNFDIDWDNDGIFDSIGITKNIAHQYPDTGNYSIRIRGTFPSIKFGSRDVADNFIFNNSARKLISVDQWGNQSWKDLQLAFYDCLNLNFQANDVPILDSLNSLQGFLVGAVAFNSNINNWDVSNIIDMSRMFFLADSFNQPINSWDVSNVTNMERMFSYCHSFNQPLSYWDVSNVKNMESMFQYDSSFNQTIDNWDVSSVTSMKLMFHQDTAFNQPLNSWDVSNVVNMNGMFINAKSFNQPINSWDVSKVTNMGGMFSGATTFNQPLDSLDVSNVTDMTYIFSGSSFNQSINNWDVSNVNGMWGMFNNLSSFNQPLNNWDVSNATGMSDMFSGASSFNQPLNNWDVSGVYSMRNMFNGAFNFNQDLSNWDVSNVGDMFAMFKNAITFDQNLGDWQINTRNLAYMLDSTAMSISNYDSTIIAWKGKSPPIGVEIGAKGLDYCLAKLTRDSLIRWFAWNFGGDNLDCSSYNHFVTTWKTDNTGGSNDSSITINTHSISYTYNYSVDWNNDGIFDTTGVTGNISHQYAAPGTYKIRISGDFPAIAFGGLQHSEQDKIIAIDQWGNQTWQGLLNAFQFCQNLKYNAIDIPNLDSVLSLESMFASCTKFNGDLSQWDISNVNNLSGMFAYDTSFNQNLSNWNTSSITRMTSTFDGASSFNQSLGNWNIDSVTNMTRMLSNSGLSIANYDSTLIGWQSKYHPSNLNLGAQDLAYCLSEAARDSLITDGWSFIGDSKDSACIVTSIDFNAASSANLFKLYPNPTNGITNVVIHLPAEGRNLESNQALFIYNQMGQLVREISVTEGKNRIDLRDQAKGVYFVRYSQINKKLILID